MSKFTIDCHDKGGKMSSTINTQFQIFLFFSLSCEAKVLSVEIFLLGLVIGICNSDVKKLGLTPWLQIADDHECPNHSE